jgi:hypothetical protein
MFRCSVSSWTYAYASHVHLGADEAPSCPIGLSTLWTGQELNDGGQGVAFPNGVRSDGSSANPLNTGAHIQLSQKKLDTYSVCW